LSQRHIWSEPLHTDVERETTGDVGRRRRDAAPVRAAAFMLAVLLLAAAVALALAL
jgi:hypothetical protein